MAMRMTVQAECNRMNRQNRHVTVRQSFPMDRFWGSGSNGDFLLAGGGPNDRVNDVISYVRVSMMKLAKPIIILDGTGILENHLINLYTQDPNPPHGQLRVYSSHYKGYDVFGGMNLFTILQYMKDVTAQRPRGSEISPVYIEAFLALVSRVTPITLERIRQLAARNDSDILRIARSVSLEERFINEFENPQDNASNFRSFLMELQAAFSHIWCRNTVSGHNISQDLSTPGVIYINAQSQNPFLLNRYLSRVLDTIITTQYTLYDLILFDLAVVENDGIMEHVQKAVRQSNETVGLCCNNIAPFIEQYPFLTQVPRHILYTSRGAMIPETLLAGYSDYDYHYPMRGFIRGLTFSIFDWQIAAIKIKRVRSQDLTNDRIVKLLKGYNGDEIALIRNI